MIISERKSTERKEQERQLKKETRKPFEVILNELKVDGGWMKLSTAILENQYKVTKSQVRHSIIYNLKEHPNVMCNFFNFDADEVEELNKTAMYKYKYVDEDYKKQQGFDAVAYKYVVGEKLKLIKNSFQTIPPKVGYNNVLAVYNQLLSNNLDKEWKEISVFRWSYKEGMGVKDFIDTLNELSIRKLIIIKEFKPRKVVKYIAKLVINPEDYDNIILDTSYNKQAKLYEIEYKEKQKIKEYMDDQTKFITANTTSEVENQILSNNLNVNSIEHKLTLTKDINSNLDILQNAISNVMSTLITNIKEKNIYDQKQSEQSFEALNKMMDTNRKQKNLIDKLEKEKKIDKLKIKELEDRLAKQEVAVMKHVSVVCSKVVGELENYFGSPHFEQKDESRKDQVRQNIMDALMAMMDNIRKESTEKKEEAVPNLIN